MRAACLSMQALIAGESRAGQEGSSGGVHQEAKEHVPDAPAVANAAQLQVLDCAQCYFHNHVYVNLKTVACTDNVQCLECCLSGQSPE